MIAPVEAHRKSVKKLYVWQLIDTLTSVADTLRQIMSDEVRNGNAANERSKWLGIRLNGIGPDVAKKTILRRPTVFPG